MAPSTTTMTSQSVTKTSLDALVSKWSAMTAGYNSIPGNENYYRHLMECMTSQEQAKRTDKDKDKDKATASLRRQAPLVNAGYAMRVASMTNVVYNFVSFHLERHSRRIDIVLLGCGLDVLGLWANSLAPAQVHIWEVDTVSVAQTKRDKLLQQNLIIPDIGESCNSAKENHQVMLEGRIREWSSDCTEIEAIGTSSNSNYHLVAADLCNIDSLSNGLQQASLVSEGEDEKRAYPTLVLFELVLAYLGEHGTERLLEWCASHLLARSPSESALVAFEALGESSGGNSPQSIVQAYQKAYSSQFQTKLQRGRAHQEDPDADNGTAPGMFHPLGSSLQQVQQRIYGLHGYTHVHACLAGTSAWWAVRQQPALQLTVPPGELFDEHAALTLHLSSYVQLVVFAMADTKEHFLLRCKLCPWQYEPFTREVAENSNVYVSVLEPKDETRLRDIFSSTYENLGEQYPAVKKMVKAALKKEFSTRSDQQARKVGESAIRMGYQASGGDFLVAIQYPEESNRRELLGGIGVRRWGDPSLKDQQPPPAAAAITTYEIHRFFVSEQHRGRGIGTDLLEMAESVVRSKACDLSYRIVATTLALLSEANHVYTKNGYAVLEETQIGDLKMKTFVKKFS